MRRLPLTLLLLTATTGLFVACQGGDRVEGPISDWPPRGHSGGPISDWPDPSHDHEEPTMSSDSVLDAGEESVSPSTPPAEGDFGGLLPPRGARPEAADAAAPPDAEAAPDAEASDAGGAGDASSAPDAGVGPS